MTCFLPRLHLAIQAYKELLLNVMCMDKSDETSLRESAKIIKGKVLSVHLRPYGSLQEKIQIKCAHTLYKHA